LIEWASSYEDSEVSEKEVRFSQQWIQQFVSDLAKVDDALDPNSEFEVVISTEQA
jgi:hypothetical protein